MTHPTETDPPRSTQLTGSDWLVLGFLGFVLAITAGFVGSLVGHPRAGEVVGELLMIAVLAYPVLRPQESSTRAVLASLTVGAMAVAVGARARLTDGGPIARLAIVLWLTLVACSFWCEWQVRRNRRPDVPASEFSSGPPWRTPELYTAEGQRWSRWLKAVSTALLIGVWIVLGLALARV